MNEELKTVIEDTLADSDNVKSTILLVAGQAINLLNVNAYDLLVKSVSFAGITLYMIYMFMSVYMKWQDFKKNLPAVDKPEEEEQPN